MSEKLSTPEVEINVSGDKQEVLYSLISTEIKRIKRIMLNNAKFREALFYPIEFNLFLGQETKDTIEEAKRIIKLVMSWYGLTDEEYIERAIKEELKKAEIIY